MSKIWTPIRIGNLEFSHRLAMAPMTRDRALPDGTPSDISQVYYAQRASLGLLITEGTQPSDDGQGYLLTPGIYTDAHIEGWQKITSAVRHAGGHVFIQLMHAGRVSHPDNTPHHRTPVAPSAIGAGVEMFTASGMKPVPVPHALSLAEIENTIDDFRHAARSAVEAGAAGVEVHGANGYLVQQFIAPNANTRTDIYGGSLENRARFAIEVVKAIAAEIGPERTAIRLSPGGNSGGLDEGPESRALYRYLVGELAKLNLGYLHVVHFIEEDRLQEIRKIWPGTLIVNRPNRPIESLDADIESGLADMTSIGQWALANPDFVERYRQGASLNAPDRSTFYGGGAKGYIDYPMLSE